MITTQRSCSILLGLMLFGSAAAAQQAGSPVVTPAADAITTASGLIADGNYRDAERILRDFIDNQRRHGEFNVSAYRQLANSQYARNDLIEAARTLTDLASEAGRAHDIEIEIRARADASLLWSEAGQRSRAMVQLERVNFLLRRAEVTAQTRQYALARSGNP